MQDIHARGRLIGLVAVAACAALTLAACSSSGGGSNGSSGSSGSASSISSGTTSGASTGSTSGVSAQVTSTVQSAMAGVTTWPGPTASVKAPSGKKITIIECGSAGIGCVLAADAAKQAADVLGWNAQIVDGKLDPTAWNSDISQAVSQGVDGIVLAAVDPRLVAGGMNAAKQAGIPVISIFSMPADSGTKAQAYVQTDHAQGGRIVADYMIDKSGGKANVLVLSDPTYPETVFRDNALVSELKAQCAGCTVTKQEISATTMSQQLAPQVTAALQQNPGIDYIWAPADAYAPFIAQGIRTAGKSTLVKLISAEGDPTAEGRVQSGEQAVDLASDQGYMGWLAVDTLVRIFAKASYEATPAAPQQLLDSSNISGVPSGKSWKIGVDYASKFAALWGK